MTTTGYLSDVDGIGYDNPANATPNPGVLPGRKLKMLGQAGNTVASNVANQGVGTVAVPALAAGATTTLTITDSTITTASLIDLQAAYGTTPPTDGQAIPQLVVKSVAAGSAAVVVKNTDGTNAIAANNYVCWYTVTN